MLILVIQGASGTYAVMSSRFSTLFRDGKSNVVRSMTFANACHDLSWKDFDVVRKTEVAEMSVGCNEPSVVPSSLSLLAGGAGSPVMRRRTFSRSSVGSMLTGHDNLEQLYGRECVLVMRAFQAERG